METKYEVTFRKPGPLDTIPVNTIVRLVDGTLAVVIGRSQRYFGAYLVRIPTDIHSRVLSPESLEILVQ